MEKYEGKSFSELEDDDKRRLNDAIIHATVFQQKTPEEDNRSVYEVFERINTGGSKLSAQEIRSCVSHGPIVQLLEELSGLKSWKTVFRSSSARLKDHELILRFLAFYEDLENYSSPMKGFLDKNMAKIRKPTVTQAAEITELFDTTISFIVNHVGEKAFRPERAFNAAVYDSVAVETAKLLSNGHDLTSYAQKYETLLNNSDFLELTSRSTAVDDRVKSRFAKAAEILSS